MPPRARVLTLLALLALALLVPAGVARANAAYDRVATAYAEGGGHLDPCAFTTAQLEAALAGIPPQVANVVPDLRRAMHGAIAAQARGACKGRKIGSSGGAAAPEATIPQVTTPTAPAATTPAPAATTPSTIAPPTTIQPQQRQPAAAPAHRRDRAPLVAAVALGALLLLALLLWLWARVRGWDPAWVARQRHAWGEAAFRTSSTWSEFTDWLRLGR
jgi:hypothetical protein